MMLLDMAQCMHRHHDVVGQIQAEHHQEDRCPIGYRHSKKAVLKKKGYSTTGDQKCKCASEEEPSQETPVVMYKWNADKKFNDDEHNRKVSEVCSLI